jgi:hypothetical protein
MAPKGLQGLDIIDRSLYILFQLWVFVTDRGPNLFPVNDFLAVSVVVGEDITLGHEIPDVLKNFRMLGAEFAAGPSQVLRDRFHLLRDGSTSTVLICLRLGIS